MDDLDADVLDLRHALRLQAQRGAACVRVLSRLLDAEPVRLDAETLAMLAGRGYGHAVVMSSVWFLVANGRAHVRWEAHGVEGWASVTAT